MKLPYITVCATIAALTLTGLVASGANAQQPQGAPRSGAPSRYSSGDEPLDYSLLNNRIYDYFEIVTAKAALLNDDGVAKVLKLARKSGLSFRDIVRAVQRDRGNFAPIAARLGVRLSDLKNVDKEKDELAAYEAAYLTTGDAGYRRNNIASIRAKAAMNKPSSGDMRANQ